MLGSGLLTAPVTLSAVYLSLLSAIAYIGVVDDNLMAGFFTGFGLGLLPMAVLTIMGGTGLWMVIDSFMEDGEEATASDEEVPGRIARWEMLDAIQIYNDRYESTPACHEGLPPPGNKKGANQ